MTKGDIITHKLNGCMMIILNIYPESEIVLCRYYSSRTKTYHTQEFRFCEFKEYTELMENA